MASMLDLTKIKKSYLPVRLPDGTVINVGTPQKNMYEELTRIDPIINSIDGNEPDAVLEAIGILFDFTARVLSNNKENREITPDLVRTELEIDGALSVIYAYTDFLIRTKADNAKN